MSKSRNPGESRGGIFAATAHVRARFSCYFHILFTSRTLPNSHVEALCLWTNLCPWKNQKRKKVHDKKERNREEKEKQAQRREKEYHSVKKRKILLCGSDWYRRSSTMASWFRTKKSPSNQHLPNTLLKRGFLFFMQVPALILKHEQSLRLIDALWMRLCSQFARAAASDTR